MTPAERQIIVLALLARLQHAWGKTRIQKLIFLAQQGASSGRDRPFDYFLYKHGPFSLDVALVLDTLRDQDYVMESLQRTSTGNPVFHYVVAEAGRRMLEEPRFKEVVHAWLPIIDDIIQRYGRLDLAQLVEEAYAIAREHPDALVESSTKG